MRVANQFMVVMPKILKGRDDDRMRNSYKYWFVGVHGGVAVLWLKDVLITYGLMRNALSGS